MLMLSLVPLDSRTLMCPPVEWLTLDFGDLDPWASGCDIDRANSESLDLFSLVVHSVLGVIIYKILKCISLLLGYTNSMCDIVIALH